MHHLATVILEHVTRTGRHFDWLFEHPAVPGPAAPLWAARLALPPHAWDRPRRLILTRLPDHRRRYLTYQGPLTRGRGEVRRVEAGTVHPMLWTAERAVLRVALRHWDGRADLRRLTDERWALVLRPSGENPLCQAAAGS